MMNTKSWTMTWGVGLGLAIGSTLVFSDPATGETLNVPGDFPTIQACINAAINGDECVVAPGTYNELINFNGKAITLRSSDGPEVTIIDAAPVAEGPVRLPASCVLTLVVLAVPVLVLGVYVPAPLQELLKLAAAGLGG